MSGSAELPDLAAQRATLTATLTEVIAEAVISSEPPGQLYGIVLGHGNPVGASWLPTVAPLFEAYRRYLLDTAAGTGAVPQNALPPESDEEYYVDSLLSDLLWEPWKGLEPEEYLPEAVDPAPYEPRVMADATSGPLEDPALTRVCEQYSDTAALVDHDDGESAVNGLLLDVAARLTERDWKGRLDVTADFVVLAYEYDPPVEQVAATLEHSLPPERYTDLLARGWIPSEEET